MRWQKDALDAIRDADIRANQKAKQEVAEMYEQQVATFQHRDLVSLPVVDMGEIALLPHRLSPSPRPSDQRR
eukprot:2664079-Prorocentrum_lima.AAC.1